MAPKKQRSASVAPDAAASSSSGAQADTIRFLVHGSGFLKQPYQLTAPVTVEDFSKGIIANPGKFKGEFSVERGVRTLTMEDAELPTSHVFEKTVYELKMFIEDETS